jgi:CDP-diacylglycerol---glycerol-3-phosphate 3-phosphatidyltransferase
MRSSMSLILLEQAGNLGSLKKRWAAFSLTGSLILIGAFAWLYVAWEQPGAQRWLLASAFFFFYLSLLLWRGLVYNHRAGETHLLPTFGAGNQLTLLRGFLLAMLAGFLLMPRPAGLLGWLPGLLMSAIAAADLFDGYLARRINHATRLGEMLDMQLDGLGLLLTTSLAIIYRQAPAWFLLVGLARFLFLAGIALRRRLDQPVFDLPPSAARRPFAGAMMGFTAVLLFPLFSPPATHLAAALFALPFLAGFTRDWLVVSGAVSANPSKPDISPGNHHGRPLEMVLSALRQHALLHWLPVLLRAVLVAGLLLKLANLVNATTGRLEGLPAPGSGLIFGLLLIAAVLLAAGAAGRVGAVCALFALGLQAQNSLPGAIDLSLITSATALFFLGSGALSAWTPEERLIKKRLGENFEPEA